MSSLYTEYAWMYMWLYTTIIHYMNILYTIYARIYALCNLVITQHCGVFHNKIRTSCLAEEKFNKKSKLYFSQMDCNVRKTVYCQFFGNYANLNNGKYYRSNYRPNSISTYFTTRGSTYFLSWFFNYLFWRVSSDFTTGNTIVYGPRCLYLPHQYLVIYKMHVQNITI